MDHVKRTASIEFTGMSPQDGMNYNASVSICRAVVLYVFRTFVDADIPMNEGSLKPIEIVAPKGTMNNVVYGKDKFQNYETICGGTGAGDGFAGASAVHSHMANTRMTGPEVLESRFPDRVDEFSIRTGSGGAGEFRGDGIVRKLRFLEPMTVTVLSSHRETVPFGASGDQDGMPGENSVQRYDGTIEKLPGNDETQMKADDVFVMKTPGGGGLGEEGKSFPAV